MNSTISVPANKRRTLQQWEDIIDQHNRSGLSGKQFCREHSIGYASFLQMAAKIFAPPR